MHPLVESRHDEREDVSDAQATTSLVPDPQRTVQLFQLRPDLVEACRSWCDGDLLILNGGPVVLVPGRGPSVRRLAGLGDYVVREGGAFSAQSADGIAQRFQPVEQTTTSGKTGDQEER